MNRPNGLSGKCFPYLVVVLVCALCCWVSHGVASERPENKKLADGAATVKDLLRGATELVLKLDLNGVWQFRLDPKDEGVARAWFGGDAKYPNQINVPGCWQAQGFGPAKGHLRHDYQGKAWYRRTATVPAGWSGKRIWLHLGAVSNKADIYVNGTKVGHVEGFLTPHELDITGAIKPGQPNVIACCVDSRGPAPIGMFNFIGRWGGLNREVFLEARSRTTIDDLFVMPDVKNATARTRIVLRRIAAGPAWQGELTVRIRPVTGSGLWQGRGTIRFAAGKRQSEPVTISVKIDRMHCWSPDDPFLYRVEAALSSGGKLFDVAGDRFGMRQFEVGPNAELLLNGQPFFVRGLGDDSVELITGIAYPDKQIYVERLKMIKRYGFNGIRFLSHTPIKEYFQAADEVGVLLLCDGQIYGKKPKENIPLLKQQVTRLAKANRNHPSWYAWSSGNEFFECQGPSPDPEWIDYIRYAHKTFKKVDPTRFFIGSEGADVFPTDIITKRGHYGTPASRDQPFDGWVDEVAYFKQALSDSQMQRVAKSSPAAAYAKTIKSLAPSGYWRLEERGGPQATDSSGQGHHGVYVQSMKAASFQQAGALGSPEAGSPEAGSSDTDSSDTESSDKGKAVRVSTGGRGVDLSDVAADTFAAGNKPFTISLWCKPSGLRQGDFGAPFSYGTSRPREGLLIALDGTSGHGQLRLGRYGNDFLVSSSMLRENQWNHIGVTYDGSLLKLFINGSLDSHTKVKLTTVPAKGRIGAAVTAREFSPDEIKAAQQYALRHSSRPYIWHEFPNSYVGPLPDLTIMDRWTGVFRDDRCISYHRKQIAALGLSQRYREIRQRSVDHFYLYLKNQFELARHSRTMDGYHYWCFTDYPGGPEGDMTTYGIFSTVYEPEKFPDPAPILQFNRETVLLAGVGIRDRVLSAGETKTIALSISHYGRKPIRNGRLHWEVRADKETLQSGTIDSVRLEVGQVKAIGQITLGPFRPKKARRIRLVVRLESEAALQNNHWDFWVFPPAETDLQSARMLNLTGNQKLDQRYRLDTKTPAERVRLIVTKRLTPKIVQQISDGKSVLLLAGKDALLRPRPVTFQSKWIRSTGTVIEKHPAMDGFPHDGYCGYQMIRLFGSGVNALNTTEKHSVEREKLTPVLWGLAQDHNTKDAKNWADTKNRWKIYRQAMICEARIGDGKLLVCCFDVLSGISNNYPEAGGLLDNLVSYALSSQFAPTSPPLTIEEVGQVFSTSK